MSQSSPSTSNRLPPVAVVNPNSSVNVTRTIADAVARAYGGRADGFAFLTLHEGPPGIVTQQDADQAALLVQAWVKRNASHYGAAVIACFSDPGLAAARAASPIPLTGLGEAGMRLALKHGSRAGVIAVASAAIERHLRHWRRLGVAASVAGERAINLPVERSGDPDLAWQPLLAAGRALVEEDGADVLLLGCAGMAGLADRLRQALGVPVIEPCAAAAQAAQQACAPANGQRPGRPSAQHPQDVVFAEPNGQEPQRPSGFGLDREP